MFSVLYILRILSICRPKYTHKSNAHVSHCETDSIWAHTIRINNESTTIIPKQTFTIQTNFYFLVFSIRRFNCRVFVHLDTEIVNKSNSFLTHFVFSLLIFAFAPLHWHFISFDLFISLPWLRIMGVTKIRWCFFCCCCGEYSSKVTRLSCYVQICRIVNIQTTDKI